MIRFGVTGSHEIETIKKESISFHRKFLYKKEETLKSNKNRCALIDECINTFSIELESFGVAVPHHEETIKKSCS